MDEIILVDLEGTMSDCNHRGPYDRTRHTEWHKDIVNDEAIEEVIKLVENHNLEYVLVTAKPDEFRGEVIGWLLAHMNKMPTKIYMRPMGNRDTSPVLKEKLLRSIELNHIPVLAFDDRADVCAMYNRNGIPTAKVSVKLKPTKGEWANGRE